ncbi:sulfotransferase [Enterovibrio sp. ZSDZ42]|uniref:Sulfotransferase n=1 Tax=Enterovibrio gelatinilyticus TaxID=2899819 RepID=A0ABT5QUN2_9GAMM|nr:sulfotransferase [Enterovibrio sp. ZSDZ42]MDD1791719.1 sulfotransferase [Enterovibrio sp. ZSDZ42]
MRNTPIIVTGFYRSGTTLLRRLLDAHSRIYCGPQIKFFSNVFGDSFDDPLASNRLFRTLEDQGLATQEFLPFWGEALLKTYDLLCKKYQKQRWADKNPDSIRYLPQWDDLLGRDCYDIVYIQRHPVDTLASLAEIEFKYSVPESFDAKMEWYMTDLKTIIERLQNGSNIHVIRYEDLVFDPKANLTRLMHSIGESFEDCMLNGWQSSERRRGIEDPMIDTRKIIDADSVGRGYDMLYEEVIDEIEERVLPLCNTLLDCASLRTY